MTPDDFVQAVNDELKGLDDEAPVSGSEDYDYYLRVASRIRRALYRDTSKQWSATWTLLSVGTITSAAIPIYTFPGSLEFLSASNDAYVVTLDGGRTDFSVVKPQNRSENVQQVYVSGQPSKLYFNKPILATDDIVGGQLILPCYLMPANITAATPLIIVDDIDWLILATASRIAMGDITYEDKAPDLNNMANAQYKIMVRNNRRGNADTPRTSAWRPVNRITDPNRSGLGRR